MDLNRRKVLSALGIAGGSAALGGLGTQALFSDQESGTVTTTAGELDLKLDWKAYHNGNQIALQEPTDVDGEIMASFSDVKPGDSGCFSLSIHNETNPAWVWLAMGIEGETDGGTPGDPQTLCEPTQYPWVCGQEDTDGNVTVSNDGSNLIVEINSASGETLNETHLHITDDAENIPSGGGGGPSPGQFDYGDSDAVTVDDDYVRYEIPFDSLIKCDADLIIATHAAASDGETCWGGSTQIPGSNWALAINHSVCCGEEPNEPQISESVLADRMLVDVFWDHNENCTLDNDESALFKDITMRSLASNMNKASGGIMPSWYTTGTKFISFVWHIPREVGNEIQGDELELSFCAYAVQRRHNDNPDNPWI